jgi:hypothetical protein
MPVPSRQIKERRCHVPARPRLAPVGCEPDPVAGSGKCLADAVLAPTARLEPLDFARIGEDPVQQVGEIGVGAGVTVKDHKSSPG